MIVRPFLNKNVWWIVWFNFYGQNLMASFQYNQSSPKIYFCEPNHFKCLGKLLFVKWSIYIFYLPKKIKTPIKLILANFKKNEFLLSQSRKIHQTTCLVRARLEEWETLPPYLFLGQVYIYNYIAFTQLCTTIAPCMFPSQTNLEWSEMLHNPLSILLMVFDKFMQYFQTP